MKPQPACRSYLFVFYVVLENKIIEIREYCQEKEITVFCSKFCQHHKVSLPYAFYNYGAGRKQHFFAKKGEFEVI